MNAADLMTGTVRTIRPDETVAAAMDLLSASEARHLPVVNDEGALLGIVSDRDVLGWLGRQDDDAARLAQMAASSPARSKVSEIMTRDPITAGIDTDIEDVVELLLEHRVGALPVVDDDGKVLGILSYVDVLRAWQRERGAAEVPGLLPTTASLGDRARVAEGRAVPPRPVEAQDQARPRATERIWPAPGPAKAKVKKPVAKAKKPVAKKVAAGGGKGR